MSVSPSRILYIICGAVAAILLLAIGAAIGSGEPDPSNAADVTTPAITITETVTETAPPSTVKATPKTVTKTVVKTKTVTKTQQQPQQLTPEPAPENSAYYANCSAAREAGVTPLRRGDSGYASHLDRDDDGVACE